jgi:hypothetical protein
MLIKTRSFIKKGQTNRLRPKGVSVKQTIIMSALVGMISMTAAATSAGGERNRNHDGTHHRMISCDDVNTGVRLTQFMSSVGEARFSTADADIVVTVARFDEIGSMQIVDKVGNSIKAIRTDEVLLTTLTSPGAQPTNAQVFTRKGYAESSLVAGTAKASVKSQERRGVSQMLVQLQAIQVRCQKN